MLARSSKRGREADATRPVRTVFLKRGASTTLHHHAEPAAWTHVVSGQMVDERWHRDGQGRLVHERRVLRGAQAIAAPADSLHRVQALTDTAFVTSCAHGCGCAAAVDALDAEGVEDAGTNGDRSALITAVGEPVPTL